MKLLVGKVMELLNLLSGQRGRRAGRVGEKGICDCWGRGGGKREILGKRWASSVRYLLPGQWGALMETDSGSQPGLIV